MITKLNKKENTVECIICRSNWLWGVAKNKKRFICPNCQHKVQVALKTLKGDEKAKDFLMNYINKLK